MTKKDYIAIARALRDIPRTANKVELTEVVSALCAEFKIDNGRFDADRFRDAVFGNFQGMRGLK
jgi:hypothetical protein